MLLAGDFPFPGGRMHDVKRQTRGKGVAGDEVSLIWR